MAVEGVREAVGVALEEAAIERALRAARRRLRRVAPSEVPGAVAAGAVLVDIRPAEQRSREGEVPGAVVVCRNVLEWRCDPTSPWRDERLDGAARLILLCREGFQSSLAAAALHDLGCAGATDVIGGFLAWRAEGMPCARRAA